MTALGRCNAIEGLYVVGAQGEKKVQHQNANVHVKGVLTENKGMYDDRPEGAVMSGGRGRGDA